MKFNLMSFTAALIFFAGNAMATEYIYRDLMANTLPSPKCASETEAIASASKEYRNSVKHRVTAGMSNKSKTMVNRYAMFAPTVMKPIAVTSKMSLSSASELNQGLWACCRAKGDFRLVQQTLKASASVL